MPSTPQAPEPPAEAAPAIAGAQRRQEAVRHIETAREKLLQRLKDRSPATLRSSWNSRLQLAVAGLLGVRLGSLVQHPPRPLRIPDRYLDAVLDAGYPAIAIVTPSYNHGQFLERTIRSVLDQKYPALEYVVQDGGSTDSSREILARVGGELAHWESVRDRGQTHALNLGFRHTKAEIMGYLNSDDVLLPGSLAYVANYFVRHPDVDVVYGHRILIDALDNEVGRWVLPPHCDKVLSWVDFIPQETLFWRRRLWERAGGRMDENFEFAMDWDLLLRFVDAGARIVRLPRFLGGFRVHAEQKTQSRSALGQQECNRLRIRVHGRPVHETELVSRIRPYLLRHALCYRLYCLGLARY